ncbi:MAG: hypothetical protein AAF558_02355 [Verrucomicrobiota bacterium]
MPAPNFGKNWDKENCYGYAIGCLGCARNPGNIVIEGAAPKPEDLVGGAVRDGAEHVTENQTPSLRSKPGYYLIAMRADEPGKGNNFHVLRRDETTGIWYQKLPLSTPGKATPAGLSDDNFDPKRDTWPPEKVAKLGKLGVWVGYFWVPDGGLNPAAEALPGDRNCCCLM